MKKIYNYINGNADINLYDDGTRIIIYNKELKLSYPLNIDIRISTKCAFGMNPEGKSFCSFCHESAKTDGIDCDYKALKYKLFNLPQGIELAIGANELTQDLYDFLVWSKSKKFICNLTINQGHVLRDIKLIDKVISENLIFGLGISYRNSLKFNIPERILNYSNTVFHVISGIDTFEDVKSLKYKNVKKILILGEKDFGFNKGNVDLKNKNHKEWFWWVHKLFKEFDVVSFDNLSLQQLNIERFFDKNSWDVFNQMEFSLYINAVEQYYSPSSRSDDKLNWNKMSIKDYFKLIKY